MTALKLTFHSRCKYTLWVIGFFAEEAAFRHRKLSGSFNSYVRGPAQDNGLADYLDALGLSVTERAEVLGISRQALKI